jgi:hypothetical protein
MESAAIIEMPLIDADGIYDPGDGNALMLLGMISTIGWVCMWWRGAWRPARKPRPPAASCALHCRSEYVHDQVGEVPDAEVQAAIGDLFGAFVACGSAYYGAVAALVTDRRFPLRASATLMSA